MAKQEAVKGVETIISGRKVVTDCINPRVFATDKSVRFEDSFRTSSLKNKRHKKTQRHE